jgi:mercuric ion binding protein
MRTLKISILSIFFMAIGMMASAQQKTESFKVAGECGMCKKKIETAAKKAGATDAVWDVETKELSVKYASASSNTAKIQKAIAQEGYDTPQFKATDEAYEKLHECCKYDRTAAADHADCCKDGKCTKGGDCCKDGKCTNKEHQAAHAAKSGTAACCKKS